MGRKSHLSSGLTIGDQVLGDVQGDFDDERAADMRGVHEADHAAGEADQRQGGLIHGTARGAHCKERQSVTAALKIVAGRAQLGLLLPNQQTGQTLGKPRPDGERAPLHDLGDLRPRGTPHHWAESEGA